ncbi:terminase large subunit [Mycolicibacterium goodii]|uniref:terminase large subunit n=1 Tax=Mycolicibacterium goodii TaxID=134601 RepID=UPI001C20D9A3|nr:terminase large subunit [Mycolicibacterium goodii]
MIVPPVEDELYPTLGGQVCDFLQERACFGPGDLKGKPLVLDEDRRFIIHRAYEVWPQGHPREGRRRWKRIAVSVRKGFAKTELMALIAYAELHPESPVRWDGWDADGNPVGRPVVDPYIPMLANAKLQVNELAYGALKYICEEGPDADFFDASLDRVIRFNAAGRPDGKAVPLANAPDSNDGGRTTFQGFDETHRLYLPSERKAVTTMEANLGKRVAQDPWSMSTTTAGEPGQNSVAETDHFEAEAMQRGEIKRPRMFYFHRQADDKWNMDKFEDRVEAIREASGPELAARTDLEDLASQWDIPNADKPYLERVWCNRWTQQGAQAFNLKLWKDLARPEKQIPSGAFVTVGMDGSRFRDSTALVMTDVRTGLQQLEFLAEKPLDAGDEWEVDEVALTAKWNYLRRRYKVMLAYGDPAYWTSTLGMWSQKAGDSPYTKRPVVQEFWTNKQDRMVKALLAFEDAITSGKITYADIDMAKDETKKHGDLTRHLGNAGKVYLNRVDIHGNRLWILGKLHQDRKFDACMAAVLSWQARMDAMKYLPKKKTGTVVKVRG